MAGANDLRHMRRGAAAPHNPSMLKTLLAIHVAGGSVALASMLLPLFSKKGGSLHRKAGWVFVGGMTVVSVTAFVLAGARALTDTRPQGQQAGVFLFYVALLTGAGVSAGIRVLRAKSRTAAHRHWWDVGVAVALTTGSLATLAYGLAMRQTLFTAFSLIGIANGISQLEVLATATHAPHALVVRAHGRDARGVHCRDHGLPGGQRRPAGPRDLLTRGVALAHRRWGADDRALDSLLPGEVRRVRESRRPAPRQLRRDRRRRAPGARTATARRRRRRPAPPRRRPGTPASRRAAERRS